MNIFIITGEKGSGKSTYLKSLIKDDFDGVITNCIDRKSKKYKFNLIAESLSLPCCHYEFGKGMNFNQESFELVNNYLIKISENKSLNKINIIIDEIGWLELEEKGFYIALTKILKNNNIKNLYLSVRYDIFEKLLKKFNITEYKLINLS